MLQGDEKISDDQINTPGEERMIEAVRYKITGKYNQIFFRAIILKININWRPL